MLIKITDNQKGDSYPTITEEYEFYPVHNSSNPQTGDYSQLVELITEITEVLLTRSDGIRIVVDREKHFPKHRGKHLIYNVQINTWDIAA